MNAPTNYKKVIIEEDSRWNLTISLKEDKTYKYLIETEKFVELIISKKQWRQIQESTLDVAMQIIEWLYFDNLEKVNY